MIDIHSHILPGLDDGPKDISESLRMCEHCIEDGIKTVVATPHTLNGVYDNSREAIMRAVDQLRGELAVRGMRLEILPGADVFMDMNLFARLDKGEVMTINDAGRFMLLEPPRFSPPAHIRQAVFELKRRGVTPIITHPERNEPLMNSPEILHDTVMAGALVQITAGSVMGRFGRSVTKHARTLIERNMAHIAASDAHNTHSRRPLMSDAFNEVSRMTSPEEASNMFDLRPRRIIEGVMPAITEPAEINKGMLLSFLTRILGKA